MYYMYLRKCYFWTGAVSKECARYLAGNVKELLKADIGISFTGVAGPDASEHKEPGTVFVGLAIKMNQL